MNNLLLFGVPLLVVFILLIVYLIFNKSNNKAYNKAYNEASNEASNKASSPVSDVFIKEVLNIIRKKPVFRYAVIYSEKRKKTVDKLELDLGVDIERWPAVFTESCPFNQGYSVFKKKKCKTCRGLTIAHKEIWDDFIHSDADYIVIFEDDAEIESINVLPMISDKLNNLTSDMTYLGHCFDTLCNHAYVLNKKAAQVLSENVKTCGQALDEQIETIIKSGIITAEYVQNKNGREHWTQGLIYQTGADTMDGSMQSYDGDINIQINKFN